MWPKSKVEKILNIKPKQKKTTVGYFAELLLAWHNSIVDFSETQTSEYSGSLQMNQQMSSLESHRVYHSLC